MLKLNSEIESLETNFVNLERQNESVSKATVGWHIDHSLKVIIKTYEAIKGSNPELYKWHFNFTRLYVFTLGSYPRGVAKAPESVIAEGTISLEDLRAQMTAVKLQLNELKGLPKRSYMSHRYFGMIHRDQVIKFLRIHTNHHLKIRYNGQK